MRTACWAGQGGSTRPALTPTTLPQVCACMQCGYGCVFVCMCVCAVESSACWAGQGGSTRPALTPTTSPQVCACMQCGYGCVFVCVCRRELSVLGRAGGLYQACPNPCNLTPGVCVYAVWLWLCVCVCVCRRELSVLDRAGGPYQACPNPATLPQERLHLSVCLCMCLSQIISQVLPFHACVCMRLSTPQLQGILGQVQNDRVTCFRLHFNYVCRCVRLQFGCICFMCAGVCVRLQFVFICFLCASGFGFILASFHVCVPQVCLSHLKLRVTSAELAGP